MDCFELNAGKFSLSLDSSHSFQGNVRLSWKNRIILKGATALKLSRRDAKVAEARY